MDCTMIQRWFSPYLDGLLAVSERATMEEHLTNCVRCRRDLDSLKQMLASLSAMKTAETPDLLPGIRAKLTRQPWWERAAARFLAPWPESLPWHGLALAGSAALIAILVVIPEYRLKMKAQTSDSLGLQFSQMSSQARQYEAYRDADRVDDSPLLETGTAPAAPPEHRWDHVGRRDPMVPLVRDGRLAGSALGAVASRMAPTEQFATSDSKPIKLRWIVADRAQVTSQLSDWLATVQGSTLLVSGGDQLVLQLPASQYPVLLHELAKYGTPASGILYGILADTDGQPQQEVVAETVLQAEARGVALKASSAEPFVTVELTLTPSAGVGAKPAEGVPASSSSTTAPASE